MPISGGVSGGMGSYPAEGTTNFLQFNPTMTNQENDSTYLAETLRANGVSIDAILPSAFLNKVWFQGNNFAAAFATALANKGYTVNDNPFTTLVSVLSNVLTNNDIKPNLQSIPFSPTPTFNAGLSNGFDIVLGGNVTSSSLVNTSIGQVITFVVKQGGSTFSFSPPSNINGWQPIDTTPNSVTVQTFVVREDGTIWPYITLGLGVSVSLGSSGYITFGPLFNNFTIQWKEGTTQSVSGSTQTIAFPKNFNTCNFVHVSTHNAAPSDTLMSFFQLVSYNNASATVYMMRNADHGYNPTSPLIIAVGN